MLDIEIPKIVLFALALNLTPAHAFTLRDFLFGAQPVTDLDPLSRVQLCENDLEEIWPTPIEFARFEDVLGRSDVYVDGWRRAHDPVAYVREHEDEAVDLLTRGHGIRAKFDFKVSNDSESLAQSLETRLLQLETINFFLGYVATPQELEALEAKVRIDLGRAERSEKNLDELRSDMDVLTQQAVLVDLRTESGYEVPDDIYELWQTVFNACLTK